MWSCKITWHERLPSIKSHDPLIMWSCKITWHDRLNCYVFTVRVPMAIKICTMVTYLVELLPIKSHDPQMTWYIKTNTCSIYLPIATKLGRMVIYLYRLLPIKSYEPLITWSCKIMWNTKTIIFEPVEYLWSPNLAGWKPTFMGSLWSHGLPRPHGKLKSLHLHYHSAYGHQTWQDGNLSSWAPAHKVTWPVDHMVL